MNIQLGQNVKDKITGFAGITTGYVRYISGCNQYLVASRSVGKEGKLPESHWFDEQRLDATDKKVLRLNNTNGAGFDKAAPIR